MQRYNKKMNNGANTAKLTLFLVVAVTNCEERFNKRHIFPITKVN